MYIFNLYIYLFNQMELGNQSKTPNTFSSTHRRNQSNFEQQKSLIQVASQMIDSVTNLLCRQITLGQLQVNEEERQLKIGIDNSSLVQQESKTIDMDQHKRMIRKFMRMNRRNQKRRQNRSLEASEKSLQQRQASQRGQTENRNKILEERRRQIEKRLNDKKMLFKQLQASTLQANQRVSSIRKKKFLYQQKQQQFYKKVTLPKLQKQRVLIQKKKQLRKPIDMSDLFNHQKKYQQLKITQRLNKSITVRMTSQRKYQPPQFIPQSYKKAKIQQQLQKSEQMFKKRQGEVNNIRKKQFARKIEEQRQFERQLSRSLEKSAIHQPVQAKEKVKLKMNREERKNAGNQYMKELVANNRKFATTRKLKPNIYFEQEKPERKVKSEYEIQIVKLQRIEKVKKIRNKKIDQIVNNTKLNDYERQDRLLHEIQKLDEAAEYKLQEGGSIETINESATIMMSSIHAKLAILGINSPK